MSWRRQHSRTQAFGCTKREKEKVLRRNIFIRTHKSNEFKLPKYPAVDRSVLKCLFLCGFPVLDVQKRAELILSFQKQAKHTN